MVQMSKTHIPRTEKKITLERANPHPLGKFQNLNPLYKLEIWLARFAFMRLYKNKSVMIWSSH